MSTPKGKTILYIASSLDGFIAGANDDLSFLSLVEQEGEDYGYQSFYANVDAVVLGRRTYEKVIELGVPAPHAEKETYVITKTPKPAVGNTHFFTGNVTELIARLRDEEGKTIFVDGGSQMVALLRQQFLLDEMVVSIIPILLGKGIPLFAENLPNQKLELLQCQSFPKGLVQLRYRFLKGG